MPVAFHQRGGLVEEGDGFANVAMPEQHARSFAVDLPVIPDRA